MQVFCAMGTQWQTAGMGGLVGLRYEALPAVWQGVGLAGEQIPETFNDLRIMERAALDALKRKHGH